MKSTVGAFRPISRLGWSVKRTGGSFRFPRFSIWPPGSMPPPGSRWDFLRKQVLTTRNVRGGPVTDWFLGGLNYQIEHHLFPGMPRPHLRHAQRLVKAHCSTLGIPYSEASLPASLALTVRHLQHVGRPSATSARSGLGSTWATTGRPPTNLR